MIKEEIEGALASWCWNNEFVSLDEHEIWSSCTWKIPNEKIEDAIEFLNSKFTSASKEEIEEIVNSFK